jgi:hypothetical protein
MTNPETISVELGGEVRLVWDLGLLAQAGTGDQSPWRLEGELDWGRFESLRVVSAALGDEKIVLAAVRPVGAEGHDEDGVIAARLLPDADVETAADALLSLEYDGAGALRRIGMELWRGDGAPLRVAADRTAEPATATEEGLQRESTPLRVRVDGREGAGVHDLVTRA